MNSSFKTVVITGISSGIGLALAQKLLQENYNVIGTTRSGMLDEFLHENLETIALDIVNSLSSKDAAIRINQYAGGIDVLINNAGIAPDVAAVKPAIEVVLDTSNTNVIGTVFSTEVSNYKQAQ